jgi:surfeit locus 1 family protein
VARRSILFAVIALMAAALFVRLGFWQLARLRERRAQNALVTARLAEPPVAPAGLPRDTAAMRFRRVRVAGTYDYAHEIVFTGRAREGAPGVYLVTPLRVPGSDTAVLVTRGWVYSPDAASVDDTLWRERSDTAVVGFAEPLHGGRPGSPTVADRPRALRWLSRKEIVRRTGYPVTPYTVVLLGDTTAAPPDSTPVRLTPPPLDEGPHLNYAIQWFAFAAIAIGGAGTYLASERRRSVEPIRDHRPPGAPRSVA